MRSDQADGRLHCQLNPRGRLGNPFGEQGQDRLLSILHISAQKQGGDRRNRPVSHDKKRAACYGGRRKYMQTEMRQTIACQQLLMPDNTVFSVQWTGIPQEFAGRLAPCYLLHRYLAHIRRVTLSLVRPAQRPDGVEFRLLWTSLSLLSFSTSALLGTDRSLTLRIKGGILVQPAECPRGELSFGVEPLPGGTRVTVRLSDYSPLLLGGTSPSKARKWLYRSTQAYLHRLVTVRFLGKVYRELAGKPVWIELVKAQEREGEEL